MKEGTAEYAEYTEAGAGPRTRVRGGQSDSVENIDSLLDWRRVRNERSSPRPGAIRHQI
jgi:hypothetical protein